MFTQRKRGEKLQLNDNKVKAPGHHEPTGMKKSRLFVPTPSPPRNRGCSEETADARCSVARKSIAKKGASAQMAWKELREINAQPGSGKRQEVHYKPDRKKRNDTDKERA
ncbi:hypothetical protein HPB48_008224 [Haemaphysalis longicornis]|uniref:Uncharacterized protein n=1 Tax=Haemaphysalis longicornis TaxID=44386 RepID=A0A9J6GZY1_HAELO|nr:hypothetical protein HPB48_008224 [Haemaphysalis longicornis]